MKNKIYFAGSIRGGRKKENDYIKIVEQLEKYGEVLTKHVAYKNLLDNEKKLTNEEIYNRDIKWLKESKYLFAEISVPSLGVGYEIAFAEKYNIKTICMYEKGINPSAMITGNKNIEIIEYKTIDDLLNKIDERMIKYEI